MRTILTILLVCLLAGCRGQQYDTARVDYQFSLETNRWDYFKADGTPAWKNVNGFDSSLIPTGGYAARRYVNKVVDGYIVSVRSVWGGRPVYFLDRNRKVLKGYFKTIVY